MEMERAREINSAVFKVAVAIQLENKIGKLPAGISLEEMLVATRLVADANPITDPETGLQKTYMHCDPRIIALLYAFEHWGQDPVRMLEALDMKFDEDLIEWCAGCWTFTRKDAVEYCNGHLYCEQCREIVRENAETQIATTN